MHRIHRRLTHGLLAAALFTVAACKPAERAGEDDSVTAADSTASAGAQAAAAPAAAAAPSATGSETSAEASLTVADIDRWQRGMDAELAAVRDAGKQLAAAKTANDTMTAMMAANETSTRAAGARGAGVDEERYNVIRSTLSPVVGYMAPIEMEMDVKQMPASMLETMKKSREESLARATAGIPPAVVEALRPRAAALRKQDLTLVGERLKAAGLGR
ncbi:MAG TPA: hypothetical protein VFJ74_09325 [Gemmatimonadaceae bacterium]|nr:hypothetical protein [Gemmatimonadaceae bacterium]